MQFPRQEKAVTKTVAAQPTVNPYQEWMLEHYPGVLKMPVSQAEQWFTNQILLAGGEGGGAEKAYCERAFHG